KAKRAGKKASLVSQQRPNMFTNRVANIAPRESVVVVLEYVQGVDYDAGEFALRFPMTITPRYMPGKALVTGDMEDPESLAYEPQGGWALPTDQVPDAHEISPPLNPRIGGDSNPINPLTLRATLDMGMPLANVDSAYHDIALSRRAGVYSIALASGVSEMDRDFVLTWRPVTGSEPQAALFTETVEGTQYGLLMVLPPGAARPDQAPSREIIFVIDTSGSMGGVSIEQARASLTDALERLGPDDRFNIIEFNSTHSSLFRNAIPATRNNVARAKEFVRLLNASGGTEMLPALRSALVQQRDPDMHQSGNAVRQVIFITDGAVGNEAALFRAVAEHLGDTRLFTVGIGSAPNSYFMRKAAEVGRGTHTHIGKLDEVRLKMGTLFEKLSRPAALNIQVDWPDGAQAWPQRVPDLYYGEPLSVAVQLPAAYSQNAITVRGELGGRPWTRSIGIADVASDSNNDDGVASLWARRKIGALLNRRLAGASDDEVRDAVLPVALAHQLLSPYTSFVAIEERISRPEGEGLARKAVANTRPRGQSEQGFAYPATATSGPAKVWLGIFGLFVSLVLHLLRREEFDLDV
ncbi:MAG: marine proteobacterial sortase target protein, partial [Halioglobus sp.]|nr:marine proteobacterial sortase target protein [Halioglobus sp.]